LYVGSVNLYFGAGREIQPRSGDTLKDNDEAVSPLRG